jgi:hypothetical protein
MAQPDRGSTTCTARWVRVLGIVVVVLLLLLGIVVLMVGEHGPGRHSPSGGGSGHTPPAGSHTARP